MQQRDYILREIEKISVLLMGLIGKMIGKKKEGVESSKMQQLQAFQRRVE